MSNRPMSRLSTEMLCERIKCADAVAIAEGVDRYVHTGRTKTLRAIGESLPASVLANADAVRAIRLAGNMPAAVVDADVTPVAPVAVETPAPAIPGITPEVLAQAIVLALAGMTPAPVVGADKPEPAPAPVTAPEPDAPKASKTPRQRKASGLFAERAKALAGNDERVAKGIRATNLAKAKGWTLAQVEAMTDAQVKRYVAKPVRIN